MLFECWPAVSDVCPTLKQHWVNVSCFLGSAPGLGSNSNTATLTECWASVVDGVPALKQHWLHVIVQRYSVCKVSLSSVCPIGIGLHNNTQLTQGNMFNQCWFNIRPPSTTLNQCYSNIDSTSCLNVLYMYI